MSTDAEAPPSASDDANGDDAATGEGEDEVKPLMSSGKSYHSTSSVSSGGRPSLDHTSWQSQQFDDVDMGFIHHVVKKKKVADEEIIQKEERKTAQRRRRPRRNLCHVIFNFISFVAIIASLSMLASQIIPLFYTKDGVGIIHYVLRGYSALFCLLFLLLEFEVPFAFLQTSGSLQNWMSRGFLYSFIGMIGAEESTAVKMEEDDFRTYEFHVRGSAYDFDGAFWLSEFIYYSSWLMVGIGVLYFLMGMVCLRGVRERIKSNYQERMKSYELEKKRLAEKEAEEKAQEEV